MADLQQQVIPPAYDGIDTDSAPDLVPLTKAPVVENLLVDYPGRLPLRGPINSSAVDLGDFTRKVPIAFWGADYNVIGANVLIGFKRGQAGADPWTTLFDGVADPADLAEGDPDGMVVNLRTMRSAPVTMTRDTIPGPRSTMLGGGVWGYAYDSSDPVIQQNEGFNHAVAGYARPRKLLEWDTDFGSAPTIVREAPDCGIDVISHLNRLWVLGGRDIPSGAPNPHLEPNTLFYSVTGGPWASDPSTGLTPNTASAWKDFSEVTQNRPRTNKIVVGSVNDVGVGLGKAGNALVIFKRRGIFTLTGYDPSNFQVRQFTNSVGCVDARSIVQWTDGVFFMSDEGYMFFDGARVTNVSESLKSSIVAPWLAHAGTTNLYAIAAPLTNGYIALTVGILPDRVLFSGLFNVPRQAWTSFSSEILPSRVPQNFGFSTGIPFLVSRNQLVRCDWVTSPMSAPAGSYGIDRLDATFTWSPDPSRTTFSGDDDSIRNELTGVEMFTAEAGVLAAIPAKWRSRLFPLSSPFYRAQLHRVLVEYNAQYQNGEDGQDSWTVTVQSGDGRNLADPYDVPGQGSPTEYPQRRTHVQDNFHETHDAQIVFEWNQDARPLARAEILSAAVEFQPTSQRRND